MKISRNWLGNYIDTDLTPEEIAEKLTLTGLEVESAETVGRNLEKIKVGRVIEVRRHPSADRLQICQVDLGSRQATIVCGAPNVAAGQKVAVAEIGAVLPASGGDGSPLVIRKAKIRGEVSEGMICSEAELGLGKGHEGILVLDPSLEPGLSLTDALNIESDTVFEIGLTPNRPDAACHIGVARDLAAVLDKPLSTPYREPENVSETTLEDRIKITIGDSTQCGRYVARIVENVEVKPSPVWLRNRLRAIGLRPVNNVVDCTNYILHEVGQPLHAFDYRKLSGPEIRVKTSPQAERFTTLDGVTREIPSGTLFINDAGGPVAIAGIMGGMESEVDESTQTILIESAWFLPSSIRKSSRALSLQTDSSYRFERGVDPGLARRACDRAAELIAEVCGGTIVSGVTDLYPEPVQPLQVKLRINRLNGLLGCEITTGTASEILHRLGIENRESSTGELTCIVPTYRPDITREVDLIEEVGRIYDYNRIPAPETTPFVQPAPLDPVERLQQRIRTICSRLQYKEITTNSLLSRREESHFSLESEQIQTLNPVSQEATTLRTTLLSGFLRAVQFNLNRNARRLRFFELGQTYQRNPEGGTWIPGIEERTKLLLGICGKRHIADWKEESRDVTAFDLKADLESLFGQFGLDPFRSMDTNIDESGNSLYYHRDGNLVARLQEVPEAVRTAFDIEVPVFTAEIDLDAIRNFLQAGERRTYRPVPRFPAFDYDAAYIVDEMTAAGELIAEIRGQAGDRLQQLEVFDVYEGEGVGEGKKSIAIRFTFLDSNKTLTIKEVEPIIQKVTNTLHKRFGAKLRS